jgi:hypothetical protein
MVLKSHIKKKKKKPGLVRVTRVPGRPAGLPGFGRAVATASLLLNPDQSSHRVDPPGRAEFNNCIKNTNSARVAKITVLVITYTRKAKEMMMTFT